MEQTEKLISCFKSNEKTERSSQFIGQMDKFSRLWCHIFKCSDERIHKMTLLCELHLVDLTQYRDMALMCVVVVELSPPISGVSDYALRDSLLKLSL